MGSRVCAQTVFLNRHAFINKNFHLKFLPLSQRGRRRLTSAGDHELHLPKAEAVLEDPARED